MPGLGGGGLGYCVRSSVARPSNTSVREFLAGERYTEAAVRFVKDTRVGEVKVGAIADRA